MNRRKVREKIIQALYQMDIAKIDWQKTLSSVLEDQPSNPYIEEALRDISEQQADIDQHIRGKLQNWSFERLSHIDRSVLRLGVYEIKCRDDIPNEVAINEAVELAKVFGTEQSGKFVNGVLSSVIKQGV